MKKTLKALLLLLVLGAAGFFGYRYYRERQADAVPVMAQNAYTEYAISRGCLSKEVTGTGTLSISQKEDVRLDSAVTVTEALVEAGDTVSAGQPLLRVDTVALQTAIDTLQEELSATESELASLSDSYSPTAYVKMPQDGRVKEVYIQPGQYIQDVMEEKGCIALLSLDGWMYVEIPEAEGMVIGSVVKVKVGRTSLDGTVRGLNGGTALVTFSDGYGAEGEEVSLTFKGQSLGSAIAHIHMPYRLTTTQKGYIYSVSIAENARKWQNNNICYLINVPVSDEYDVLMDTRERQSAQLASLRSILLTGTVDAPRDGIVASIVEPAITEYAAKETLASLCVGEEKEMVVSVDELDIISVAVGQEVSLVMDALPDDPYTGTVSKVSQLGTAASGVTVYDVTLSVNGDERLKLGMNGTATIRVEERENVLLVPIAALNTSRGKSYVWLKSDDASEEPGVRTEVQTGLSDESYAEVTGGLSEGDVVLVTREASTTNTQSERGGGMEMPGGMVMPNGEMGMPSGAPGGNAPQGGKRPGN